MTRTALCLSEELCYIANPSPSLFTSFLDVSVRFSLLMAASPEESKKQLVKDYRAKIL